MTISSINLHFQTTNTLLEDTRSKGLCYLSCLWWNPMFALVYVCWSVCLSCQCLFEYLPVCACHICLHLLPQTTFVRHDTPHPKELKARHAKFVKQNKGIDGHVIPHNEKTAEVRLLRHYTAIDILLCSLWIAFIMLCLHVLIWHYFYFLLTWPVAVSVNIISAFCGNFILVCFAWQI